MSVVAWSQGLLSIERVTFSRDRCQRFKFFTQVGTLNSEEVCPRLDTQVS